jgi:acyl-CoA reductase-like NAD-dependent aldehyde dehydrogenase
VNSWGNVAAPAAKVDVEDVNVARQHNIDFGGAAVVSIYRRRRMMATSMRQQAEAPTRPGDSIVVENPATSEVVATLPACTPQELADMAARARSAQPGWQALGCDGRAKVLRRMQKWVLDNDERFLDTLVAETGKTREDAVLAELGYAADSFGLWAKHAGKYLADEKVRTSSPFLIGRKLIVRYEPLGLVGVIGPWNYPFTNTIGDAVPALAAGNSVIVKPSSVTPMTSLLIAEGFRECGIPDGVFQVVVGRGPIGEPLIDLVDFIMFTGSTETGRKVMERAAKTLTPMSLELGGKDPMIVLADADLERAANAALFWSMQITGQTCISVERVYVEEPIYDQFSCSSRKRRRSYAKASPATSDPSMSERSSTRPRLTSWRSTSTTPLLAGGHRGLGHGAFFEPTVLADVDHTMESMREETFGPTLPIMKVADADEAIRLANDSPYGLQASVFTKDLAKGEQVARRIEVGAVVISDCNANYVALEAPMGGWKSSGLGVRHGPEGIRKYTQPPDHPADPLCVEKRPLHVPPPREDQPAASAFAQAAVWSRQAAIGPRMSAFELAISTQALWLLPAAVAPGEPRRLPRTRKWPAS